MHENPLSERSRCSALLCSLLMLVTGAALFAQNNGAIDGRLVDSSQAAAPGASLRLTNVSTNQSRTAPTAVDGYFNFADLPPGSYRIEIAMQGFKSLVLGPMTLTVGQHMTLHPELQLGAVSEHIEVTGTPPPVTTASSTVAQLIDTKRIEELPLNGRNALQLVSLVPGVVSTGTAGQFGATQTTFSSSGGRNIDMNFTLDGAFNMNSFYAIPNEYPNPDALQEFSVSSREYSAAFGRGTTSVSAVTKSGTNAFHGSAFEFLRNTDLDSRPFFAAARSSFKRNQFGGTFGGPLIKDKLFFFLGYQGTKVRGSPGDYTYTTLTAAERRGDFSSSLRKPSEGLYPGGIIPASRIRPYAANFINNYLPMPNQGADQYRFSVANTLDQNQGIARIDYAFSEKDRISGRYFINDVPQVSLAAGSGSSLDSNWLATLPTRFQNTTLTYTRTFNPALANDFHISYVRSAFGLIPNIDFSLTSLGLPVSLGNSTSGFGLRPESSLSVSGFFTADVGASTRDVMATTHLVDTVSWMKGRHKLSFGTEIYWNRVNEIQNWQTGGSINFNGQATGSAAADMLVGQFNTFRQISSLTSRLRQTLPAIFAQDDIRLGRTLTLSLGLRWEPYFGYKSEDSQLMFLAPGKQSQVFPLATQGLLYPGDSGVADSIVGARRNNLAPRVGLAWDVRGDGKTSIRAGFGSYYAPLTRGISLNRFTLIQPFVLDVTVNGGDTNNIFARPPFNGNNPFPRPTAGNLNALKNVPFVSTANETVFGLPFKTQTDYQWSFSIQQALSKDSVLEVNYVGSSSSHLFTSVEGNAAIYIPGASTTSNTQARRPFNEIGSLNVGESALSANYNSLQASYRKNFTRGFSILSSYTWSKALGVVGATGEGSNGPRNPNNYHLDYGPQTFDIPHNFVTSFLWNIPGGKHSQSALLRNMLSGWQLTGIYTVRSGTPLTLRSGLDNSRTGIGGDTPDVTGNWRVSGDRSKASQIQQWFNTAAFRQNDIGTFGSLGLGVLRNPGFWNWDLAGSREFSLGETRRLQLRGSLYNALNHANLGTPNATLTSSAFGRITSATDPRVVELSLRVVF